MEREFEILRQTRNNTLAFIDGLSDEQLAFIPEGFNNNIYWNLGHILITQQLLCYKLAGLSLHVPEELVSLFAKANKPDGTIKPETRKLICDSMLSSVDQLMEDYESGAFGQYKEYPTSYGYSLKSHNI